MGLRKTRPLNCAFLTKLGWKILQNENDLWISIIKSKYHHSTSFSNGKLNQKTPQFGKIF